METRTSTPKVVGTAPLPAVIATLSAPLLPAAACVDRLAVPHSLVVPLVTAGLFIGGDAILTPDTGEHLPSGAERGALAVLALAGAAATPARNGASA